MKSRKPQTKIKASSSAIFTIGGEEFVTVKEAAKMLEKSVAQIRRYAQNKAIPSQKIAKTIIFRLENVKKFTPPAIGRPYPKKS